jgi:hypothetical protein
VNKSGTLRTASVDGFVQKDFGRPYGGVGPHHEHVLSGDDDAQTDLYQLFRLEEEMRLDGESGEERKKQTGEGKGMHAEEAR